MTTAQRLTDFFCIAEKLETEKRLTRTSNGDNQVVAALMRRCFNAEHHPVKEGVGKGLRVRYVDGNGNRPGTSVGKAARHVVGNVFQLPHRLIDLLAGLLRNDPLVIQHPRNGGGRYTRGLRHVSNSNRHKSLHATGCINCCKKYPISSDLKLYSRLSMPI